MNSQLALHAYRCIVIVSGVISYHWLLHRVWSIHTKCVCVCVCVLSSVDVCVCACVCQGNREDLVHHHTRSSFKLKGLFVCGRGDMSDPWPSCIMSRILFTTTMHSENSCPDCTSSVLFGPKAPREEDHQAHHCQTWQHREQPILWCLWGRRRPTLLW